MEIRSTFLLPFNGTVEDSVNPQPWNATDITYNTTTQKYGSASAVFNGTSSRVVSPFQFTLGRSAFTFEGWFKSTSAHASGYQRILAPASISNPGNFLQIWFSPTSPTQTNSFASTLEFSPGGSAPIVSLVDPINDGNWHHFAFCRNDNSFLAFLDGVLKQTAQSTIDLNLLDYFMIGRMSSSTAGTFLKGELDDVHLITDVCKYTENFTPPAAELTVESYTLNVFVEGFEPTHLIPRDSETIQTFVEGFEPTLLIPRDSETLQTLVENKIEKEGKPGGYEIGGITSITGTVKKYINGVLVPYDGAVIRLAKQTSGYVYRQSIPTNGYFSIERLDPSIKYVITLDDWYSNQSRILTEVFSPNVINFVLDADIVVNNYKVEGKVYDQQGNPIARKVCVFSKTTDEFLGSAISDETTGFYSIGFVSPDPVYVVCFPNENEDMNAKIYDRVVPVPI